MNWMYVCTLHMSFLFNPSIKKHKQIDQTAHVCIFLRMVDCTEQNLDWYSGKNKSQFFNMFICVFALVLKYFYRMCQVFLTGSGSFYFTGSLNLEQGTPPPPLTGVNLEQDQAPMGGVFGKRRIRMGAVAREKDKKRNNQTGFTVCWL